MAEVRCTVRPGATITTDENGGLNLTPDLIRGISEPEVVLPADSFEYIENDGGQIAVDGCYVEFKGNTPSAGWITIYVGMAEGTKKKWMEINTASLPGA